MTAPRSPSPNGDIATGFGLAIAIMAVSTVLGFALARKLHAYAVAVLFPLAAQQGFAIHWFIRSKRQTAWGVLIPLISLPAMSILLLGVCF